MLTITAISVGVAMVVILTSMGEGLNRYVISEFTQFGTNILAINPGKITTLGTPLGIIGTVRPLTIEDALSLKDISYIERLTAVVWGNAEAEASNRKRRLAIYGVTPEMPETFKMKVNIGRFLPPDDIKTPRAFAVLGSKAYMELFNGINPIGKTIRISGERYRVLGVMESKGQILGIDMDDTIFIPTVRAMDLFDNEGLKEIDLYYKEDAPSKTVINAVKKILISRHGKEDFTITSQEQMLDVLGSVLDILTIAVGALGGISLVVGLVGILTIMTIAVNERQAETGLLLAMGSTKAQILWIFLSEALILAFIGAFSGLVLGILLSQLIHIIIPVLPVKTRYDFAALAVFMTSLMGMISGVLPAIKAAGSDPIDSLRAE
jgi:putative ABC transport system permease protein